MLHLAVTLPGMRNQLALLDPHGAADARSGSPSDFRLDERTKELGRKGVAAARAALEQATRTPAA